MNQPEINESLVEWAFGGYLPYGTYPEGLVEELNLDSAEFMAESVALSHFMTAVGEEGQRRMFPFAPGDVVQGEFRGFELTETGLHLPVGIRMNIDLVPGSSPGLMREEVVPLWSEQEKSLRVPNFDYERAGGSIWRKIIANRVKIQF